VDLRDSNRRSTVCFIEIKIEVANRIGVLAHVASAIAGADQRRPRLGRRATATARR
jgi:hypothetical protein